LQIAATQLNNLLGIKDKTNNFIEAIQSVIEHYDEVNEWDICLGMTGIIVLFILKECKRLVPKQDDPSTCNKVSKRTTWFLGLASNAILVVAGVLLAYFLSENGKTPFTLIDKVNAGLPDFKLPSFNGNINGTYYDFIDLCTGYGTSLIFVPLICVLESIAVAKAFSNGKALDATQEMLALGLCNFFGSFVGSMPVTGSFTRSAVNSSSGVKTPLGSSITGAMVLLAIAFLTDTFSYIPKTILAAVIMVAMFYLFDDEAIIYFWKTKKLDLIPFFITFAGCLLWSLEYGILVGIAVHLIFILYPVARPKLPVEQITLERKSEVESPEVEVLLVKVGSDMQFPVAEYFRDVILKQCIGNDDDVKNERTDKMAIVFDGSAVLYMDATVARNVQDMVHELEAMNWSVVMWNFRSNVEAVITGAEPNLKRHFREGDLDSVVLYDYNSNDKQNDNILPNV